MSFSAIASNPSSCPDKASTNNSGVTTASGGCSFAGGLFLERLEIGLVVVGLFRLLTLRCVVVCSVRCGAGLAEKALRLSVRLVVRFGVMGRSLAASRRTLERAL